MNDETFISGGITNASPFLLAFLEDKNGINTASGIGHGTKQSLLIKRLLSNKPR
jgi:hypothetical protein